MHHEVQAAEPAVHFLEHLRNLFIVGHVQRKDQRILKTGAELTDVFFQAFSLVGDRQSRPCIGGRLRDRP